MMGVLPVRRHAAVAPLPRLGVLGAAGELILDAVPVPLDLRARELVVPVSPA